MQLNILLVETDTKVSSVLSSFFLEQFHVDITCYQNLEDILTLLKSDEKIDLILSRNVIADQEFSKRLLNFIYDNHKEIPLISLGEVEFSGGNFECLPDKFKLDDLSKLIIKILKISKEDLQNLRLPDYIAVPIHDFYIMNHCDCDVYIRICKKHGEDQYVKRIHAGDTFDRTVLSKYESMNVEEFYVKKEDRLKFMDNLLAQIVQKLGQTETDQNSQQLAEEIEDLTEIAQQGFEIGQDLLLRLGVTEHTIKIAEANINSMVQKGLQTSSNNQLAGLLKAVLANKGSYSYKHSYLIAIFSAGLVPHMEWGKNEQVKNNISKLVYVAYFHDLFLEDDLLVRIDSKLELYKENLREKEKEAVIYHANKMATMVQSIPHTPAGVDIIIRQHHGTTNGVGFADGPNASLSILSIVFIVIEKFVSKLLSVHEEDKGLKNIFDSLYETFDLPSYRRVIDGLKEMLIRSVK